MSLLMEALRKAEEAKRQAQEGDTSEIALPAEPAPHENRPIRKKPLSQQSSLENEYAAASPEEASAVPAQEEMETINFHSPPRTLETPPATSTGQAAYEQAARTEPDDGLSPTPTTTPVQAARGDDEVERYLKTSPDQEDVQIQSTRNRIKVNPEVQKRAAAAMFAAKRTSEKKAPVKTVLVLSLILLLPLGGAGFWYFTQSSSGLVAYPNPPPAATQRFVDQVPSAAVERTASAEPASPASNQLTQSPPAETVAPGPEGALAEPELSVESPATEQLAQDNNVSNASDKLAVTPANPDTSLFPATTPAQSDDPLGLPAARSNSILSVTRSQPVTEVHPQLQAAYNQLRVGNLTRASQLYQEVLVELPNNRDAMLGMASVETSTGNVGGARQLYSKLLELNPKDPLARTGLLQTVQGSNNLEQESQLKSLSAQYPNLAPLALLQGNFYAQQGRWSEAQGAYFNALLLAKQEPGAVSPDYAFNLAISLEQLGQPLAARNYYQQAATMAQDSPPGFDPQLLQSRLSFLGVQ